MTSFEGKQAPILFKSARHFFSWQVNLTVFAFLVTVVLFIFFLQLRLVKKDFTYHSLNRSRIVASVIMENVQNGLFASELLDKTIGIFLNGSGNFAAYLESIEPFSADELSAFSKEAGLAGITIIHEGITVSGPENWFPEEQICKEPFGTLRQNSEAGIAFTVLPLELAEVDENTCLIVGVDISSIAIK